LKFLRNPWLHVAISTVAVAIAQLLQKQGAVDTRSDAARWSWTGLGTLASPLVWLGIVFTIVGFLAWLYALRQLPLSRAFPVSQAVHVLVPLSSWLVLGEHISATRWCGIIFVIIGLAIVARPVAKLEEKL
jgi:undecaprenyl phosphate-alpha-L-ara4N flippase subunit ArnF